MDDFDLNFYRISMLYQNQDVAREYTLNITSTHLDFPFGLILNDSESVTVSVSAVSKCSQESLQSPTLSLMASRDSATTGTHSGTNSNHLIINGMLYKNRFIT